MSAAGDCTRGCCSLIRATTSTSVPTTTTASRCTTSAVQTCSKEKDHCERVECKRGGCGHARKYAGYNHAGSYVPNQQGKPHSHFGCLSLCVGFQSVMSDPVVAGDGHTYERSAITKWLQTNRMYATPHQSILSTKHHCCCCLQIPGNPRTNRQPKADTELRCEAPDRRLAARWFPWCASRASRTRGGRRFRLRVRDAGGEFHKLRAG